MILGCILLSHTSSFQQINKEKDFIKNYKAPDFKQKRLNFNLSSDGFSRPDASEKLSFDHASNISYGQYSNTKRYQGSLYVGFRSITNYEKKDGNEFFFGRFASSINTINKFYVRENFFIGAYGRFSTGISKNSATSLPNSAVHFSFVTNPIVSAGFGRLEPVRFARKAMDIEKSLKKGGRLKRDFTGDELTMLADRIAQINNVRFYDRRLRLIEQFEELDKTLTALDIITEKDISYFSYLSDAYLYAQNYNRFSGVINEFGISQSLVFSEEIITNTNMQRNALSYLFYNFQWSVPQSYAFQHDYRFYVISGIEKEGDNDVEVPFLTSASYSLGIHPNTRTSFRLTSSLGLTHKYVFGVSAGVSSEFNYYISPRVRFNAKAGMTVGENYIRHEVFILPNHSSVSKHNMDFELGFRYAIF